MLRKSPIYSIDGFPFLKIRATELLVSVTSANTFSVAEFNSMS